MSFSRLPLELRLQIWEDTIEDEVPQIAVWNQRKHMRDPHYIPQVPVSFPVAMRVCSESRRAIQERLNFVDLGDAAGTAKLAAVRVPVRAFKPEVDALFVPKDNIPALYAADDLRSWDIFCKTRQVVVSEEVIPCDVASTFFTVTISKMEALRSVCVLTDRQHDLPDDHQDELGDHLAVRRLWLQTRHNYDLSPIARLRIEFWFSGRPMAAEGRNYRFCEPLKLN